MSAASLQNKRILVGITGGIAAYKSAFLVSKLAQSGASVTVAMTEAAQKFIGTATFSALSARPVCDSVFSVAYPLGAHIELANRSELLCVAPLRFEHIFPVYVPLPFLPSNW